MPTRTVLLNKTPFLISRENALFPHSLLSLVLALLFGIFCTSRFGNMSVTDELRYPLPRSSFPSPGKSVGFRHHLRTLHLSSNTPFPVKLADQCSQRVLNMNRFTGHEILDTRGDCSVHTGSSALLVLNTIFHIYFLLFD